MIGLVDSRINGNNSSNTGNGTYLPMQPNVLVVYLPGVMLHIFIMRVLILKLKLRKQVHAFLLSLSVSDLVQMITFIVTMLVVMTTQSNSATTSCHNAGKAFEFFVYSMIAISSGSIIALCVERYIACIHAFRLHSILSKKRKIALISLIWCAGLICGLLNEIQVADGKVMIGTSDKANFTLAIYPNAAIIFVTSAALIFVQLRLLVVIQRRRNLRILPGGGSRSMYQGNNTVLQQVKTSVAASAVVVAYLTCMLPMALLPFLKPNMSPSKYVSVKKISVLLNLLSPVLNPIIYGIGMKEIRNAILSDLRAALRKLLIKIFF